MRSLVLVFLTLALSGSAAVAMPGATVGLPLGSPAPFGTMRRDAEPPVAEAAPENSERRVERRARKPRPVRQQGPKMRR